MIHDDSAPKLRLFALGPLLLAIIIDTLGFGLTYPIMTAMFAGNNATLFHLHTETARHFYLSLGYLLYPAFMFFGATFLGDLSDSHGRKITLLICVWGLILGYLFMAIGVSIHMIFFLLIGRALTGFMAGSQPIAQASIADISTEKNKARNMAMMTFALAIGLVIGPVIGGVMSDPKVLSWFNFSTPFYFTAILCVLTLIWLQFGYQDLSTTKRRKQSFSILQPIKIILKAFLQPKILLLVFIFLLMQIGFGLYFQYSLVVLQEYHHYSTAGLGIFNGFLGLNFIFSLIVMMPILTRHLNIKTITILALVIAGITEILSGFVIIQWAFWLLAIPLSCFDMIGYTAMLTNFSDAASATEQGWALGIASSAMAIAWTVTGSTANLLSLLGPSKLIVIGGCMMVAGGVMMYYYQRQYRN